MWNTLEAFVRVLCLYVFVAAWYSFTFDNGFDFSWMKAGNDVAAKDAILSIVAVVVGWIAFDVALLKIEKRGE